MVVRWNDKPIAVVPDDHLRHCLRLIERTLERQTMPLTPLQDDLLAALRAEIAARGKHDARYRQIDI